MNKQYIQVSDKELGNQHKCAVCCNQNRTVSCFEFERSNNLGDCSKGYHYREKKK